VNGNRPKFVIPEWADWMVALLAAVLVALWLGFNSGFDSFPIVLIVLGFKIVVLLAVYFLVLVIIRTIAEPSRLYNEGLSIYHREVEPSMRIVQLQLETLRKLHAQDAAGVRSDISTLDQAVQITRDDIVAHLLDGNGMTLFNGMVELRPKIDALAKILPGHVSILQTPFLAADKYDDKIKENRQGMAGYLAFAQDMAVRVASGQIFTMTTGARMLSALANVFATKGAPR
jgi:hypothetical protein